MPHGLSAHLPATEVERCDTKGMRSGCRFAHRQGQNSAAACRSRVHAGSPIPFIRDAHHYDLACPDSVWEVFSRIGDV